jgi:hypothetical protein
MAVFTPEKAREQALHDWQSRSVKNMVVGTIDIAAPTFHWGGIFYTESLGCDYSDDAELFCRTYNLTIRYLLRKYGVPSWAPVKRLPGASSCLATLANEPLPFSAYRPASSREESVVQRVLFHWGPARPLVYSRLPSAALLLLGGILADQSGRVDVLDVLNEEKWLAFYHCPRVEFPRLPWDGPGPAPLSAPLETPPAA